MISQLALGTGSGPLEWERTEYKGTTDFNAERYEVTFTLLNTGDQTVEFLSASTSCGCVAMNLAGKLVESSMQDDLTVAINLMGRQGDQTFAVRVNYKAGEALYHKDLRIELSIPRLVTIAPPILVWDNENLPEESIIHFMVHPSQPLKDVSFRNLPEWVSLEWIEDEDKEESYQLILRPQNPPQERRLTTLQIVTEHPNFKNHLSSIYLRVR